MCRQEPAADFLSTFRLVMELRRVAVCCYGQSYIIHGILCCRSFKSPRHRQKEKEKKILDLVGPNVWTFFFKQAKPIAVRPSVPPIVDAV
jgi:hypothetical protein